jgi:hypothetical protein
MERFRNNFKASKKDSMDGINQELLKYEFNTIKHRLLNIMNTCWMTYQTLEE